MTLQEIKQALSEHKRVFWSNELYEVKRFKDTEEYNIICSSNNHCIGLTWMDGATMNGKEEDFFIIKN
jgi:hypothetical protein